MHAVQAYRPQPAGSDSRVAAPTRADLAFATLRQIVEQQICGHRDRMLKGVKLAAAPNVCDMILSEKSSPAIKVVIQIRKDQVLQYADDNIDSKISQLPSNKKTNFNNLLSDLTAKIQNTDLFCPIIFACEPEANRNLCNSKLVKSIAYISTQ